MSVIRRGYVYTILAASLAVAAIGLKQVLVIAVLHLWNAATGSWLFEESASEVRESLSLSLALVAVAVPICLFHWRLARRWSDSDEDGGDRGSGVRGLYVASVLAVALFLWAFTLFSIAETLFMRLFGEVVYTTGRETVTAIVVVLVAASIWIAHGIIRIADSRSVHLSSRSQWAGRIYLYGAMSIGLVFLIGGVVEAINVIVDAIVDHGFSAFRANWAETWASAAIARTLIGVMVWIPHWLYASSLVATPESRSAREESSSRIRILSLHLVLVVTALSAFFMLSLALSEGLQWLLGGDPSARNAFDLALNALPFIVVAWYYWWHTLRDATIAGGETGHESATRLHQYLTLFFAIVFWAAGMGYLLNVALENLFELIGVGGIEGGFNPDDAGTFISFMLAGGVLWVWTWRLVERSLASNPERERARISRRAYLYLVLTLSTLALLVTLAVIVYRVFQLVLGVRDGTGLIADTSPLLSVTIIAGALLAYHLRRLLMDTRGVLAAEPPVAESPLPERLSFVLRLSGTSELEMTAVVNELRDRLPAGVDLEVERELPSQGGEQRPVAGGSPSPGLSAMSDDL